MLQTSTDMEYEYAKNDMHIHNKIDNQLHNIMEASIIDGVYNKIPAITPITGAGKVAETIESITGIAASNAADMMLFYNNIKNADIDSKDITVLLFDNETIDAIRPQYLIAMANDIVANTTNIISGKIADGDVKNLISTQSVNKYKRQFARTSFDENLELSALVKTFIPATVPITKQFIVGTIIPFFKKLDSNINDMNREAGSLINAISTADNILNTAITAFNVSTISPAALSYIVMSIKNYADARSYIMFLSLRKVGVVLSTLTSFINIKAVLMKKFPEGTLILHESVYDGDFKYVDDYTLFKSMVTDSGQLINMATTSKIDYITGKYGIRLSETAPSETENSMDPLKDIFVSINTKLSDFVNGVKANMTFDECQDKSGLTASFVSSYDMIVSAFISTSADAPVAPDLKEILFKELSSYGTNFNKVCGTASEAYHNMLDVEKELNQMMTMSDMSKETIQECIDFMVIVDKQFKDMCVRVYRATITRFDYIDTTLESECERIETSSTDGTTSFVVHDIYDMDYVIECMNDDIDSTRDLFYESYSNRVFEYEKRKAYMLRREYVLLEADNADADSTKVQPETTVKKSSIGDKVRALIQRIIDFINKICETIMSRATKMMADTTSWYTAEAKKKLETMDFSSIELKIAAYNIGVEDSVTIASAAINSYISALNNDSISKLTVASASDMLRKAVPSLPLDGPISDNRKSVGTSIENYFKYKLFKVPGNSPVTISGDELKKTVGDMIKYVDGYSERITKFSSAMKQITNTMKSKFNTFNVTESVITEADEEKPTSDTATVTQKTSAMGTTATTGDTTKSSADRAISEIGIAIQVFESGVANALEGRNTAYLSALRKIISM